MRQGCRQTRSTGALATTALTLLASLAALPAAVALAHPAALHPLAAVDYLTGQRAGFGAPARAATLAAQADARARALTRRASSAMTTAPANAVAAGSPNFAQTWEELGPAPMTTSFYGGPNSGRVDSAATTESGEILIGTAGGGVWSSTDNGASWVTHTDHVSTGLAIGALAVDPSNQATIYAGTGEANNCGDCFYGGGVLKSTDGGASWTAENPGGIFSGVDFAALQVDPKDGSILYAATTSGFYISKDGGATWAHPSGTGFTAPTYGIALDRSTSPTTVYIATAGVGIRKSTDGAKTFITLAGGLPAASEFGVTALGIGMANSSHPHANEDLYAAVQLEKATDPNGGDLSMFSSRDGGKTWVRLPIPAYTNQSYGYGSGGGTEDQAFYDNTLAVDPANPEHVIAGGITLVESTDGGASWRNVNGQGFFEAAVNVLHPDFHASAFATGAAFGPAGKVIVGCDGGVYEYDPAKPGPAGVSNLNGHLNTGQFYEDLGVYNNGEKILGGLQDNGTAYYTGATGWPEVSSGDGGYSAINPLAVRQQFAEGDMHLEETTDEWASSTDISPPTGINGNFVPPMTIVANSAAVDEPTVYYGGADLWVTHDPASGAPVWTQVTTTGTPAKTAVSAIAVAPSDPAVVYVGFDNGTLLVSINATSPVPLFSDISPGVGHWITHIDVDPAHPYSIRVSFTSGLSTQYFPSEPMVETGTVTSGVTPSATYTNITGNLPSGVSSNSVVSDHGALVVATDVGVFSTAAVNGSATTWSAVGSGLPNVQVIGLSVDANGDLYAATHGRGVWKLAVPPVNVSPPAISGEAREGQTLTESHGGWEPAASSYGYQWLRCDSSGAGCSAIPAANQQSYRLTAADVGYTIRVQETASNDGETSAPAMSAATGEVLPRAPVNTALPAISGEAREGQTLTESHGGWEPASSPISYGYQWLRCDSSGAGCSAIPAANQQSYRLTAADGGDSIRVQETASNGGGTSAPATSAAVGAVAGAQTSGGAQSTPSAGSPGGALTTSSRGPTLTSAGTATAFGRATAKGSYVLLRLACSGGRCQGSLTLTAAIKARAKRRHPRHATTRLVASASFSLSAGQSATIRGHLSRVGSAMLHKAHKVTVRLAGSDIVGRRLVIVASGNGRSGRGRRAQAQISLRGPLLASW